MRQLIVIVLLSLSHLAYSAELTIPDYFVVLKVDNIEQSSKFFSSDTQLNLSKGRHVIVLQYKDMFEDDENDHHVTIKSKPFVLLLTVEQQESYLLKTPEIIDEKSAKTFTKELNVKVITKSEGRNVEVFVQELAAFETNALLKAINSNVIPSNNQFNESVLTKDKLPLGVEQKQIEQLISKPENLTMLKFWWGQASKEQRKVFLEYVQSQ